MERSRRGAQPVALVAERVDDRNFVRAELRDTAARSSSTSWRRSRVRMWSSRRLSSVRRPVGGSCGSNSTAPRCKHAHGGRRRHRPRGCKRPRPRPPRARSRSARQLGSTSAAIALQDFRAQTLGLSVHVAVRLDAGSAGVIEQILGKGNHSGFSADTDQEFHSASIATTRACTQGLRVRSRRRLRCRPIVRRDAERWYDVVLEFDPGDYRDPGAGVHMIVDGVALPTGPGTRYRSNPCTAADPTCWTIDSRNGDAPLRIGTSDGTRRSSPATSTRSRSSIACSRPTSSQVCVDESRAAAPDARSDRCGARRRCPRRSHRCARRDRRRRRTAARCLPTRA